MDTDTATPHPLTGRRTTAELAALSGRTPARVRQWMAAEGRQGTRWAGVVLWSEQDCAAFLARNRRAGRRPMTTASATAPVS